MKHRSNTDAEPNHRGTRKHETGKIEKRLEHFLLFRKHLAEWRQVAEKSNRRKQRKQRTKKLHLSPPFALFSPVLFSSFSDRHSAKELRKKKKDWSIFCYFVFSPFVFSCSSLFLFGWVEVAALPRQIDPWRPISRIRLSRAQGRFRETNPDLVPT